MRRYKICAVRGRRPDDCNEKYKQFIEVGGGRLQIL